MKAKMIRGEIEPWLNYSGGDYYGYSYANGNGYSHNYGDGYDNSSGNGYGYSAYDADVEQLDPLVTLAYSAITDIDDTRGVQPAKDHEIAFSDALDASIRGM